MAKNKQLILGIIVLGALVAGFFYINGSDEATRKSAAAYFFGALLTLVAYYLFMRKK